MVEEGNQVEFPTHTLCNYARIRWVSVYPSIPSLGCWFRDTIIFNRPLGRPLRKDENSGAAVESDGK